MGDEKHDRPGRPRLYDWARLLARRSFLLRPRIDYFCRTESIVQQVRNAASARGVLLDSVDVDERGWVTVKTARREQEPAGA
jgi:hypothetical protein